MAKRTILSPSALQPHPTATSLPLSPSLSLPLSIALVVHILLEMLMISPLCILMQGLSTLFPFIHIQMCSYCLFALRPFKMPFWNMPFDKHIIGQVPAVISALFNVSKLESEWGPQGRQLSVLLCPHPLTSPRPLGESPFFGRMSQSPAWHVDTAGHPPSFISTWRLGRGRKTLENHLHRGMALYAGRLDSCTLSQECDRRTAL